MPCHFPFQLFSISHQQRVYALPFPNFNCSPSLISRECMPCHFPISIILHLSSLESLRLAISQFQLLSISHQQRVYALQFPNFNYSQSLISRECMPCQFPILIIHHLSSVENLRLAISQYKLFSISHQQRMYALPFPNFIYSPSLISREFTPCHFPILIILHLSSVDSLRLAISQYKLFSISHQQRMYALPFPNFIYSPSFISRECMPCHFPI